VPEQDAPKPAVDDPTRRIDPDHVATALSDGTTGDGVLDRDHLSEILQSISRMNMPFGKYGPKSFPPDGVPIFDLPPEYLAWFSAKGFPKGKLGTLMKFVFQMKVDGADMVFDEFRKANGGRHPLRKTRKRSFEFKDENSDSEDEKS